MFVKSIGIVLALAILGGCTQIASKWDAEEPDPNYTPRNGPPKLLAAVRPEWRTYMTADKQVTISVPRGWVAYPHGFVDWDEVIKDPVNKEIAKEIKKQVKNKDTFFYALEQGEEVKHPLQVVVEVNEAPKDQTEQDLEKLANEDFATMAAKDSELGKNIFPGSEGDWILRWGKLAKPVGSATLFATFWQCKEGKNYVVRCFAHPEREQGLVIGNRIAVTLRVHDN